MDDYPALVRKVEALRQRKAKADGALEQLLKRLKEEFGCKHLAAAKKRLEELEQEERDLFTAYKEAREEFDRKWGPKLKELE